MYIVLWGWLFLRILFLCFIYAYFSIRICKQNKVTGIALSILLLYSLSLSGIIPNKFQHDFIFLYPFFCVGILIKTYHSFIDNHTIAILLLSATVFLICLHFWQGYEDTFYSMNTSMKAPTGYKDITGIKVLYKTLFRTLTGASGSIAFIILAKVFQSVLKKQAYPHYRQKHPGDLFVTQHYHRRQQRLCAPPPRLWLCAFVGCVHRSFAYLNSHLLLVRENNQ